MEPDRDAPSAARKGPGGRTAAARSANSRKTPAAVAPAPDKPTLGLTPDAVAAERPAESAAPAAKPKGKPGAKPVDEQLADPPVVEKSLVVTAPAAAKAARTARKTLAYPAATGAALSVHDLTKRFGGVTAVDAVDLEIEAGSFYGFVGPNGAGKTTTLAMITGLLRPDSGVVRVHGVDVWRNGAVAKKALGVLPDNLRLFDRLTGAEFLYHAGALRGLDRDTIGHRVDDLSAAFGLRHSLDRFVSDYSAGMVKKIAIAAAMIHSPRLLVLDEPFESVDPVSANAVIGILKKYAAAGGTVLLSSHSMTLIERTCDSVAIIADGRMLAAGPLDEVLSGESLETRFVELAGGATAVEGMEWLQSYSD